MVQFGSKAMDKVEGSEATETGQEAVEVKEEEKAESVGQSEEQKQNVSKDESIEKSKPAEKRPVEVPHRRRRKYGGYTSPEAEEANTILSNTNRASRVEKALNVNFMTGSSYNSCVQMGHVASIKLSEHIERVRQEDGSHEFMVVEIYLQINFFTGEWDYIKCYCCVEEKDPIAELFPEALRFENLSLNDSRDPR